MSIAKEIERLQSAKQDIKSSIEKHGVPVSDDATLDLYSQILDTVPYTVKGTFTPEEDTDRFEISGLAYVPQTLSVSCQELYSNVVAASVVFVYAMKGNTTSIWYTASDMKGTGANAGPNTSVITWGENSVIFKIPAADTKGYLKKGYTYDYVISGGFAP